MLWAILAVLAGLGDATVYAFMKRLKKLDASLVVWIEHAFSVPFLLAMLYFFFPDNIHKGVYLVGPINALLLALTMLLLFKAFSSSNLSITVPLLCLTPLFLLFTSLIMLHEAPSYPFGYVGVILIVVGTYALNINLKKKKFFEPFRALYYNPGSRLAIGAAFMMSIMANMFKIGINYSNPFFYSAFVHSMVAAFLFPFLFIKCRRKLNQLKENLKSALIIGFASGSWQSWRALRCLQP
jgi:uncharacterized membrane protein